MSFCKPLLTDKSNLWTDSGVDQNFQRDVGAVGRVKIVWTKHWVPCLQGKYVWSITNGPESSPPEVSVEAGIGPWTALPSLLREASSIQLNIQN